LSALRLPVQEEYLFLNDWIISTTAGDRDDVEDEVDLSGAKFSVVVLDVVLDLTDIGFDLVRLA